MEGGGQQMTFQEADRRYAELRQQHEAGTISDEEFDEQVQQLKVQDHQGRWWAKSGRTGQWQYREGDTWVQATPPVDGDDRTDARPVEASRRSPIVWVIFLILAILCAALVIFTFIRGASPGYFTVLFVVLAVVFGYLARRFR